MKTLKRNAVILSVLLFVCVAVYLNWTYNKKGEIEDGKSQTLAAETQDGDKQADGSSDKAEAGERKADKIAESLFREQQHIQKVCAKTECKLMHFGLTNDVAGVPGKGHDKRDKLRYKRPDAVFCDYRRDEHEVGCHDCAEIHPDRLFAEQIK